MVLPPLLKRKRRSRPWSTLWPLILGPVRRLSDGPERQALLEDCPNGLLIHCLSEPGWPPEVRWAIQNELTWRLEELTDWKQEMGESANGYQS
jgi:hypothetical protein